jgi:SAM-dependent methyltransferase
VAPAIAALVAEMGVTSVLDVACGDGYWMPDLPGYVGIDVAPEAIERARQRHPGREYRVGDIRDGVAGTFGLVITRDAMQHLSLAAGVAVLEAIRATGTTWLLASSYVSGRNVDIRDGEAYSPDLEQAPFSLGQPERMILDGYTYHDPDEVRDARKHLGLWRLR